MTFLLVSMAHIVVYFAIELLVFLVMNFFGFFFGNYQVSNCGHEFSGGKVDAIDVVMLVFADQ